MPSLSSEWLESASSPYINRFLQPDTIIPDLSNPQSWNRYSYVTNRPVNFNDPTGHCSIAVQLLFGGQIEIKISNGSCPWDNNKASDIGWDVIKTPPHAYNGPDMPTFNDPTGHDVIGFEEELTNILSNKDMPSDKPSLADFASGTTLKPGPYAKERIKARGPERDWTDEEIEEINRIGSKYGCHTCGTRNPGTTSGNFIPDHQPPSKLNSDNRDQYLYPHCLDCMRRQGGEVRKELLRRGR